MAFFLVDGFVINTEYFKADTELKNKYLNFKAENERNLTEKIIKLEYAEELIFVTYSGYLSVFPLDFGSSIPFYFFKQRDIVLIGQLRISNRDKLVNFGKSLYKTVEEYNKKVSIFPILLPYIINYDLSSLYFC